MTCTLGLLLIKACVLLSAGFCSRSGREVSAVSECRMPVLILELTTVKFRFGYYCIMLSKISALRLCLKRTPDKTRHPDRAISGSVITSKTSTIIGNFSSVMITRPLHLPARNRNSVRRTHCSATVK